MKPAALYLAVLAGGAAVGAGGMGAVNVVTGRVPIDGEAAEAAASLDEMLHADGTTDAATHEGDPAVTDAAGGGTVAADPHAGEPVGGGAHEDSEPDGAHAQTGDTERPLDPAQTAGGGAAVVGPARPDSAQTAVTYQRLGRIFAAMRPEEAAEVLSQLEDAQLEGILLAMQERSAAPILAAMDPARVASVSRRALEGRR